MFDEQKYQQLSRDEKIWLYIHGATEELALAGLISITKGLSAEARAYYVRLLSDGFEPTFDELADNTAMMHLAGAFGEFNFK